MCLTFDHLTPPTPLIPRPLTETPPNRRLIPHPHFPLTFTPFVLVDFQQMSFDPQLAKTMEQVRENTKEARRDKYLADASSVSSTSSSSSGGSDAQSLRTARSKRSATAPRRTRRGTASSAKLDSLPNASPKKKPVPKKKVVASKAKKPAKGKGKTAKAQAPKKAAAKAKKPVAKKKKPAAKRQPVVPSSPARSVVSAVSRTSPACFTVSRRRKKASRSEI